MSADLTGQRIGFLGGGAMAKALATGLVRAGVPARQILASDPDPARRDALAAGPGVRAVADNAEVVEASHLVVIAVKPGVVADALRALEALPAATRLRPLWVSIAAGVSLATLEERLPRGARVVRAMPNTPSLVGAGATALAANASASAADRSLSRALFESVGIVWEAPSEDLLDAVTGLSGSGPAYVCVFLEALADAGVRMGLPRDAAYALSFQTVLGTARLAQETGRHPADLKDQVTSPGGTTIAGLERLEAGGLRAAVHAAVAAATERSRELGKKR